MATNTRHGARAFRHFGAGVMRATRAEPRLALSPGGDGQLGHGAVFGIEQCQVRIHAGGHVVGHAQLFQPLINGAGDQRG